ncbi:MAG: 3-deoxy-8-phosphooctulonate synthase [Aureibaculum sp.]|nr:3-deoxy-8-phosphooctulonate synthase [Aureibaculum sp.]
MSKHKVLIGDINCGADELFLISGPCVIEEESIMMKTAEKIKEVTEKLKIPVIYKSSFMKDNRSSVDYYIGPGMHEGLKILEKIKTQFGFPILTDIHYPDQVGPVAEVVDIIQIPAYLVMQTRLMVAAGESGIPINLKHAQFLAPENMDKPVKKIESTGNNKILLTERGYAFGYNDLIVDPRSFYELKQTGYPVIFDVTHSIRKYGIPSADPSGGARQYLDVLARAGVAAGVDGLFVETHPCPNEALCDAASQLDMRNLEEFLKPLLDLHGVEVNYRSNV